MVNMSDIASMYSDAYASAANQAANKLQSQLKGTDYSKATDDELMAACKQFEAYFVEQLYKGMMKTIPQSQETSNYTSQMMDFYKDKMIQSMAEQTTQQSDLGLARMLYEQMKRNYSVVDLLVADKDTNASTEEPTDSEAVEGVAAI